MVLGEKQTHRTTEQNRDPEIRDPEIDHTATTTLVLTKVPKH